MYCIVLWLRLYQLLLYYFSLKLFIKLMQIIEIMVDFYIYFIVIYEQIKFVSYLLEIIL